jgi:hypothetical protein
MTDAAVAKPLIPVLKRRQRSLAYLAGVTGVFVVIALLTLWMRSTESRPAFPVVRMFPGLEAKVDGVASIQIETKDASFNVVRNAEGQWILPDKDGYPADFNHVRSTILGLAELDLVDARTTRSDWHERLGLGLPKTGGSGTLVTLKDGKGEVLASVIAGVTVEGGSTDTRQAIYVRRANDAQAFVARGNFKPEGQKAQWLSKAFIVMARDRIKTAAIKPLKGRAYTVTRATAKDQNFRVVEALPAGRILRTEGEANGVGNALLGISFDDVVPAAKIDFTNAARAAYLTFDGLTLSLSLVEKDRDFWLTANAISNPVPAAPPAPATPGKPAEPELKPDVEGEAKEINKLMAGWAYKVPRYKAVLMTAPLEDLTRPAGSPEPTRPTAPPR